MPKKSIRKSSRRSPKKSPRKMFKLIRLEDAKKLVGKTITLKGEQDTKTYKVKVLGFVPKSYIEENGETIYQTYSTRHTHLAVYHIRDHYEYTLFPYRGVYIDRSGLVKYK